MNQNKIMGIAMRTYWFFLLTSIAASGMENASQENKICSITRLPILVVGHILSYAIGDYCQDGFYVGKTKKARNFLTTCKQFYNSEELNKAVIMQIANEYGLPIAKLWASLYLNTPPAHNWLKTWLATPEKHFLEDKEIIFSPEEKKGVLGSMVRKLCSHSSHMTECNLNEQKSTW